MTLDVVVTVIIALAVYDVLKYAALKVVEKY